MQTSAFLRLAAPLAFAILLAACGGGGSGGARQPTDPAPPAKVSLFQAGRTLIKLRADGGAWVAMTETPHGFMDRTVMERRLELSDGEGRNPRPWQPPSGWTLVDFALHAGGDVSALLSDGTALRLVRLDARGAQLAMQDFVDPAVALDPYFGRPGEVRDRAAMAALKTLDAARIAPSGAHVGIALRAGGNNVVAYRFEYAGGQFTQRWRTLVEPGIYLDGLRPMGGTYDPFEGVDNHWKVQMDVDARGRMAVAVLVSSRADLGPAHAAVFGDALPAGFTEGVLLTVLDERGARLPALAIDHRNKSEVHAVKWSGDAIFLAGRVRSVHGGADGGWDGWVARADVSTRLLARRAHRVVDIDRGDVVLDVLPLDGDAVLIAGATGYTQNPGGESVSDTSAPLLARLDLATGALARTALPSGARGNQVRSVVPYRSHRLAGGIENVPGTHSADGDATLLTTDAYVREVD